MSELKYQYGRLTYRKKSTGVERGREDWWLTRNRDGTTTMRCLAMTDDSKLVRDVIYTRSSSGRPTDAYIRLQLAEQFIGTGYYQVHGNRMEVVVDGAQTGHALQTAQVPTDFFFIATHAVMLDGWIYFNYDRAQSGVQTRTFYNSSTRWDGTDGPLGKIETFRVKVIGEEEVTVPAGTFKATHFTVERGDPKGPTTNIWVAGEDKILLRCDWGELDLEYLLTSWKREQ